ncbi:hypothetical protein KKE60_05665 [Patescibacteria group bacterium]|nr:hypothetical protein [Patescibacteria group bacterium]
MSVQGVKEIQRALQAHKRGAEKAFRRNLYRAGLFLQRESQKIVPIDKNILRASANTRPEGTGFDVEVVVSYGTDYALYVHENLEARHKPGRCAKFLEKPLREKRDRIKAIAGGAE